MTSTIKNLNDKITTNLASASDYKTIGQLAGAVDSLSNTTIDCVASTAALPSAANNTGRFVGVGTSSALCYRYSDGYNWKCDYTTTSGIIISELWVWGDNGSGQLGTGSTTPYSSPVTTAGGGTNWCSVSGGNTSSAIKTDGTLWVWGDNISGQVGVGDTTNRSSPVTTAGGGTNWCQSSSTGYNHMSAIKTDGTLWTWGCNFYCQLGTGNTTNYSSPVTTAGGGTNWCATHSGFDFNTFALKTDGTLWSWGFNAVGYLGTGDTNNYASPVTTAGGGTNWCKISYTSGLKTDGTLWVWGCNYNGALGTGNVTNYSSPVTTVGGGTNWCSISRSTTHSVALKTDGTLWTWGWGSNGRLGTGNTSSQSSPVTTVGGGTNWRQTSASYYGGGAIKTDGTLWVWGYNGSGQLGTGDIVSTSSPVTNLACGNNWYCISSYNLASIKRVTKGF